MLATLGSLYCRRNLRIRGREQPGDLLGQCLIRRKAGQLALPQIEISSGQRVEGIVGSGSHVSTIDHRCAGRCSQPQSVSCRTAASGLM
jgi:hypothetical protein